MNRICEQERTVMSRKAEDLKNKEAGSLNGAGKPTPNTFYWFFVWGRLRNTTNDLLCYYSIDYTLLSTQINRSRSSSSSPLMIYCTTVHVSTTTCAMLCEETCCTVSSFLIMCVYAFGCGWVWGCIILVLIYRFAHALIHVFIVHVLEVLFHT